MHILKVKQWKNDMAPTFKKIGATKARRLSDGEVFERFVFYKYQIMNNKQYYYRILDFHENRRFFYIHVLDSNKCHVTTMNFNPNHLLKPET